MAKQPTKAANNVYCIARKKAAEFNSKFSSREGASEFLGISKDSLTDYELDFCKVVPVDKVVIMAEAYNAPELLNHYCCNECPIGKRITPIIESENIDNLYKFAISVANTLDDSVNIQKTLLKIKNVVTLKNIFNYYDSAITVQYIGDEQNHINRISKGFKIY